MAVIPMTSLPPILKTLYFQQYILITMEIEFGHYISTEQKHYSTYLGFKNCKRNVKVSNFYAEAFSYNGPYYIRNQMYFLILAYIFIFL